MTVKKLIEALQKHTQPDDIVMIQSRSGEWPLECLTPNDNQYDFCLLIRDADVSAEPGPF